METWVWGIFPFFWGSRKDKKISKHAETLPTNLNSQEPARNQPNQARSLKVSPVLTQIFGKRRAI